MARLAFWYPPSNKRVDTIELYSSASSDMSAPSMVTTLAAKDGYRNWVTHYNDEGATTTTYYQAHFFVGTTPAGTYPVGSGKLGVTPLQVTPQDVLDTLQGVPAARVSAELIQRYLESHVAVFEKATNISLSTQTATQERYGSEVYNKILGQGAGGYIQLRHFPVIDLIKFEYVVRGAKSNDESDPIELTAIDAKVMYENPVNGYNRGLITAYVTSADIQSLFALYNYRTHTKHRVEILISYTHGWPTWPADIEMAIVQMATASILEIMGEAGTGGLSSRGLDGYSESFTASATTTVFSARRIWYEKGFEHLLQEYKKPLYG